MSDNPYDVELPIDDGMYSLLETVVVGLRSAMANIRKGKEGHKRGLDLILEAIYDIEEVMDDDY